MEEVRISDWPEPPGSHAWLPAYGFQHEIVEKDDYFSSNGETGSTHALYLETIVEETSDDLRSERSSAATWLSDSDVDSVIHVRGNGGSECDSESEREWACPAKRRRRERGPSPASSPSLSRSSSLAQFESLERSCAAPASPSLSPDSLESPPPSPPPPRVTRPHLSAENLSEDSGYSERARRPPPPRRPEIALSCGAGSAPCLAAPPPAPDHRPPRTARATSLPAELDVCAEPRRQHSTPHRARFRQAFEVSDNLTVSVADLTALDYRAGAPRRPRLPPPPPPPRLHAPQHPPPPPPTETRVPPHVPRVPEVQRVTDASRTQHEPPRVRSEVQRLPAESPRIPEAPPVAPPRVPRVPPRAPSDSPAREPSVGSDSTTESELAFAREMEATARRLDESARRALADTGAYDRELSVLTARRLRDSWGAWDDVLDELRRRLEPSSPSPSPPRTPSPDPGREPPYTSTPLRAGDARVRSTPELRSRGTPQRETPDELRASLQLVAPPPPAPPARSVSAGSKGVTFSPVVAEVSWREASASTSISESTTSASDDAADAEVVVVGEGSESSRAHNTERASAMTDAAVRAPRSRIAGFLSRFANFRFSGRKEKKTRSAGANARTSSAVSPADAGATPRAAGATPQYVRIPLKEEGVSVAAATPVAGGVAHKPPRPRPPPAPAPGVLETDVDTQRTVLHARSLLALAPSDQRTHRPHKSMEFLLDKDSAQTVQQWVGELGSSIHFITPEMHRENAQAERYCRTVLNMLRIEVNNKGAAWSDALWKVQLTLNITKQATTQTSPLQLLTGVEGTSPVVRSLVRDVALSSPQPNREALQTMRRQQVSELLAANQHRQDAYVNDRRRQPRSYAVGDLVFVSKSSQSAGKLDSCMRGPYKILQVLPHHRYELELLAGSYGKKTQAAAEHMVLWRGEWTPDSCEIFFECDDSYEGQVDVNQSVNNNAGEDAQPSGTAVLEDSSHEPRHETDSD